MPTATASVPQAQAPASLRSRADGSRPCSLHCIRLADGSRPHNVCIRTALLMSQSLCCALTALRSALLHYAPQAQAESGRRRGEKITKREQKAIKAWGLLQGSRGSETPYRIRALRESGKATGIKRTYRSTIHAPILLYFGDRSGGRVGCLASATIFGEFFRPEKRLQIAPEID